MDALGPMRRYTAREAHLVARENNQLRLLGRYHIPQELQAAGEGTCAGKGGPGGHPCTAPLRGAGATAARKPRAAAAGLRALRSSRQPLPGQLRAAEAVG